MTGLGRIIAAEIAERGPIPVCRFMELALGHPELGYYRTRDPLGAGGDFITAPEVSQMFGEMLGLWAAVVWRGLGGPAPFTLTELGPGRGTLMADALRAGAVQPGFTEAARLNLVETSPVLAARQREALAAFDPVILERVADLPAGPMIAIANEFFDALPIRQLVAAGPGWAERRVGLGPQGGCAFAFTVGPAVAPADLPDDLAPPETPGAVKEVCPAARDIARTLAGHCVRAPGAVLIIDYGPEESATGETLQAVRGHRYADPLAAPGSADLTAHVDFAALARAAREAGAQVFGPVTQRAFLLSLGIATRAERLARGAAPARAAEIGSALRRLVDPAEMGTLFKVMAFTSPGAAAPPGFEVQPGAAP